MKLYAVRNKEGKFFKSIGYGHGSSGGKSWVDGLDTAKLYTKVGQAKSRVTFFFKAYPQFGCPDIVEFTIDVEKGVVLDMMKDTTKKIKNSKKSEIKRLIRNHQWSVDSVQKVIDSLNQTPEHRRDRHFQKMLSDKMYELGNYNDKIAKCVDDLSKIQ